MARYLYEFVQVNTGVRDAIKQKLIRDRITPQATPNLTPSHTCLGMPTGYGLQPWLIASLLNLLNEQ